MIAGARSGVTGEHFLQLCVAIGAGGPRAEHLHAIATWPILRMGVFAFG